MRRATLLTLLGVLLISLTAYAANRFNTAALFLGGAKFGPAASVATYPSVTRVISATATIDFANATITCEGVSVGAPGVRGGDFCTVATPASGGAANSVFTCFASDAGEVTIKHCPVGTASNPASADFTALVVSTQ